MKVSINQVKINRVGINTAQVRGIRLSSAVADRGHKVDFPFSDSLVDYWNFGGKSNFDKDRTTVTGLLGNVLTAYNFGWSSGSGYGLYANNFNNWIIQNGAIYTKTSSYVEIDNINGTTKSGVWLNVKPSTDGVTYVHPSFKIRITGLNGSFATFKYREDGVNKDIQMGDGVHVIPSVSEDRFPNTTAVIDLCAFDLPKDRRVRIEEVPEYEGAIVTDGVDDYLKLDKTGYKVRTVIIKFKPINIKPNIVNSIVNIHTDEVALQYDKAGVISSNFTTYKNYEEYGVGKFNVDKNAATPLTLGCKLSNAGRPLEYCNLALYSIAIYDRALSDQEVQEVINFINYGTTNPIFALNFDNFAYKAVDYPDFATGKVTTNKIVVNRTTKGLSGELAIAISPSNALDPIEVPSYKIKVTGLNQYSVGEGNWAVGLMGMMIDSTKDPWTYPISKDGVYDIPAISLSDGICNLAIVTQVEIDKPIEIEILYDKNITKSFPETKQIFP